MLLTRAVFAALPRAARLALTRLSRTEVSSRGRIDRSGWIP
jgi:hypothetical protein